MLVLPGRRRTLLGEPSAIGLGGGLGLELISSLGFAGQFVYFLQQAGVSAEDSFSFNLGSVAMGFVGTILSWFIMNRFGRRTIMVWGTIGLTVL